MIHPDFCVSGDICDAFMCELMYTIGKKYPHWKTNLINEAAFTKAKALMGRFWIVIIMTGEFP